MVDLKKIYELWREIRYISDIDVALIPLSPCQFIKEEIFIPNLPHPEKSKPSLPLPHKQPLRSAQNCTRTRGSGLA